MLHVAVCGQVWVCGCGGSGAKGSSVTSSQHIASALTRPHWAAVAAAAPPSRCPVWPCLPGRCMDLTASLLCPRFALAVGRRVCCRVLSALAVRRSWEAPVQLLEWCRGRAGEGVAGTLAVWNGWRRITRCKTKPSGTLYSIVVRRAEIEEVGQAEPSSGTCAAQRHDKLFKLVAPPGCARLFGGRRRTRDPLHTGTSTATLYYCTHHTIHQCNTPTNQQNWPRRQGRETRTEPPWPGAAAKKARGGGVKHKLATQNCPPNSKTANSRTLPTHQGANVAPRPTLPSSSSAHPPLIHPPPARSQVGLGVGRDDVVVTQRGQKVSVLAPRDRARQQLLRQRHLARSKLLVAQHAVELCVVCVDVAGPQRARV